MKNLLVRFGVWLVGVVVASGIASQVVAQQLVPPPPVLGVNIDSQNLVRLELKIDALQRTCDSIKALNRAVFVRLNPLKMEQDILDLKNMAQ